MGQLIEIDPAVYGALLEQKRPRAIRTDAEYDAAAGQVEDISFREEASAEEREYAELLLLLRVGFYL